MLCDMCHKDKPNVEQQPSRSQLIFGGFNIRIESRCRDCEKKVCKDLDKIFKNLSKGKS
jgi:hypothetical protein